MDYSIYQIFFLSPLPCLCFCHLALIHYRLQNNSSVVIGESLGCHITFTLLLRPFVYEKSPGNANEGHHLLLVCFPFATDFIAYVHKTFSGTKTKRLQIHLPSKVKKS